jgi:hypothetical protein
MNNPSTRPNDNMVANVPWGTPFDSWTDRQVERGLAYLDGTLEKTPHGEGAEFFPNITKALAREARERGMD